MCHNTFFGRFSSIVWVSTLSFSHSQKNIYKNHTTHTQGHTHYTLIHWQILSSTDTHTTHKHLNIRLHMFSHKYPHTNSHAQTHFYIHTCTYTCCLQAQPRQNSSPHIKGSGITLTGTLTPGHADDTSWAMGPPKKGWARTRSQGLAQMMPLMPVPPGPVCSPRPGQMISQQRLIWEATELKSGGEFAGFSQFGVGSSNLCGKQPPQKP